MFGILNPVFNDLAGFDLVPNKTANLSNVKVCRILNLGRPALIAKEITEP